MALDLPVDRLFTYRVPEAMRERIRPGQRVEVRFRGKRRLGVVADVRPTCDVKGILDLDDVPDADPFLSPDLLDLGAFVARYYGAWLERFERLIAEGQQDGSIPPTVDARAAGTRLAATADGIDSMLYLGIVDHDQAHTLAAETLERELG